jgi:uncharacterized membrane protein YeaQ/YmgE (transglycosylase-associated protein family)
MGILTWIIVGLVAGVLASMVVGGGYGLLGDIIVGIVGAFIGVWLMTTLRIMPFAGFLGSIINATIGAIVLLAIIGLIRRR